MYLSSLHHVSSFSAFKVLIFSPTILIFHFSLCLLKYFCPLVVPLTVGQFPPVPYLSGALVAVIVNSRPDWSGMKFHFTFLSLIWMFKPNALPDATITIYPGLRPAIQQHWFMTPISYRQNFSISPFYSNKWVDTNFYRNIEFWSNRNQRIQILHTLYTGYNRYSDRFTSVCGDVRVLTCYHR